MANTFKGFKQVNGLAEGFSVESLENGYIYFVRTDENKENGYVYFNGKKYGTASDALADANDYTDTEVANALVSASTSANTLHEAITAETEARENAIAQEVTDRNSAITDAISELAKEDTAEDGKYVSSVSQENGVITVSRETIPVQTVSGDSYISLEVAEGETKAQATANVTKMEDITEENNGEGTLVDAADVKAYIDGKAAASNTKVAEAENELVLTVTSATSEDESVTYSVASTLKLNYVSPSDEAPAKIQILGKEDALVSEIDATDFIKDSFLKEVTKEDEVEEGVEGVSAPYLKFVWNTVNGDGEGNVTSAVTRISIAEFIDTYTVSGGSENYLTIDGYKVAAKVDVADGLASNNALTAETEARENAITALTEAVETSANTLNNAITAETEARENAITALTEAVETSATTLNNAITAETEARENAITALTETVEDLKDYVDSALTEMDEAAYAGVQSTGKTIVAGELDEDNMQNLEVNLEESTDDTKAEGHIEITKNENGGLYAVLYVDGDDVD